MATKKIEFPSAASPTPWKPADATALQALAAGTANAEQQQRAINWIIYNACGTYDIDYRPDALEHAAVSGRRMVGLEIVNLLKINVPAIIKKPN